MRNFLALVVVSFCMLNCVNTNSSNPVEAAPPVCKDGSCDLPQLPLPQVEDAPVCKDGKCPLQASPVVPQQVAPKAQMFRSQPVRNVMRGQPVRSFFRRLLGR